MKAPKGLFLVLVLLVAVGGCRSESQRLAKAAGNARKAVGERMEAYRTAVLAGDTAALRYWAENSTVQQAGRVMTHEELRSQLLQTFADYRITAFDIQTFERAAHDSGTVVYAFISQKQTVEPRAAGGQPAMAENTAVIRWVRQADGTWVMERALLVPRAANAPALPVNDTATPPAGGKPDTAGVRDAIITATGGFMAGLVGGKPDDIAQLLSEDVQYVEPGKQYVGRAAVLAGLSEVLDQFDLENGATQTMAVYVHDGGAVAYQYGNYSETMREKVPPLSKKPPLVAEAHFNFLARWERTRDGKWRLDRFYATPQPMVQ